MHLYRSRAVVHRIFFHRKYQFSVMRAQHVLSYHLIWVPCCRSPPKFSFRTGLQNLLFWWLIPQIGRTHRVHHKCRPPTSIVRICSIFNKLLRWIFPQIGRTQRVHHKCVPPTSIVRICSIFNQLFLKACEVSLINIYLLIFGFPYVHNKDLRYFSFLLIHILTTFNNSCCLKKFTSDPYFRCRGKQYTKISKSSYPLYACITHLFVFICRHLVNYA